MVAKSVVITKSFATLDMFSHIWDLPSWAQVCTTAVVTISILYFVLLLCLQAYVGPIGHITSCRTVDSCLSLKKNCLPARTQVGCHAIDPALAKAALSGHLQATPTGLHKGAIYQLIPVYADGRRKTGSPLSEGWAGIYWTKTKKYRWYMNMLSDYKKGTEDSLSLSLSTQGLVVDWENLVKCAQLLSSHIRVAIKGTTQSAV